MSHGIYTAAAGARARNWQVDVIANNLANASTPGFRQIKVAFEEVLDKATSDSRHLVQVRPGRMSSRTGALIETGNTFDLALRGQGFFLTEEADGKRRLVRSAPFQRNAEGNLVDPAGRALLTRGGSKLRIEANQRVTISGAGEVFLTSMDTSTTPSERLAGIINIVDVPNRSGLAPAGQGAYMPTDLSGPEFGTTAEVASGWIEQSNVNPVEVMVELIELQRGYQSMLRAINTYKEADQKLVKAVG